MTDNDLIPCTDELNRLKDFLADFKKPMLRYAGTDWLVVGLGHDALIDNKVTNYGGPYEERH